jgi:Ca2+-binding RTX toxin-like protein
LKGSYSTSKMMLLALVVTSALLLSTMIWLQPTTITQAASAQTVTANCYGYNATIVGTPTSENIVGTLSDDIIVTLEGSDRVHGRGGNDIICSGSGHNTIIGGAGNDLIDGGNGSDFLSGGTGDDRIIGGIGSDILFGEYGDDRLEGGLGNDTLLGQADNDFLFGDAIDGATGRQNIDTGDGGSEFDSCVNVETVTNCEG